MRRTISLKLNLLQEQSDSLLETQQMFAEGCNQIANCAQENRCWNQVALHNLCYSSLRSSLPNLGSQMVCNGIRRVCGSYKAFKFKKTDQVPKITYKEKSSIHYCARTFSLKGNTLSLFSVHGRVKCFFAMGGRQAKYMGCGELREGELICKGNRWFFNVVIELPDVEKKPDGKIFAVDLGEKNLATTSCGTIYGGGTLRHKRDKFLDRRGKLQSNGSTRAKACLKRISGKERRHVKEVNHCVSKAIIREAVSAGAKTLVLEDLRNIRKRIKGNKRLRTRLHRWPWRELQQFLEYKAEAQGIEVLYVNPAYTSVTCSSCDSSGLRHKHLFQCSICGSYQHSDRNAAINLCKLGKSVVLPTAPVNVPKVATIIG